MSFRWESHSEKAGVDEYPPRGTFVSPEPLRIGTLYFCSACQRPWYLDEYEEMMSCVPRERVALIRDWSRAPIGLNATIVAALREIGTTPPDLYGNGREYCETPCGVVTKSGERLDVATVSLQRHAPFEEWRSYRLGSEIREIYPSPVALPLPVRLASARAEEVRMGFSPTLIEMSDGKVFVLNGRHDFFAEPGYQAKEAIVSNQRLDFGHMPKLADEPKPIVRFIADADS